MRNKIILIIMLLVIFNASFILISSDDITTVKVSKGKNVVVLNITEMFYARDFVRLNPQVEVISYTEKNVSIGYVNYLNGVGENFVIRPEIEYEIIAKEDCDLILPIK